VLVPFIVLASKPYAETLSSKIFIAVFVAAELLLKTLQNERGILQ